MPVQEIRNQLQLQEGYQANEQRLFFQGQEMDPAAGLKMLTSAPIPEISVLMRYDRKASLLKFQDPTFQFKVHFISCQPLCFQATGSETVFEVVQRIFLAEGVPTISLRLLHGEGTIWEGPVYEVGDHDNPTLREIGTKQNSVIRADVVFKDIKSQFCLPDNGLGGYGLDRRAGMMRMPSGSRPNPDLARTGVHVSFKSAPKFVEDPFDGLEGYIA
ncbi:putative Ubiquitin-like domain-containing protein [Septoria linicola]|nr:putative Ubiquitin-like domain-containing protein [Septoria linicola]